MRTSLGQRCSIWLSITFLIYSINLNHHGAVKGTNDEVPPDELEYCDFNDTENGQDESSKAEVSFCQEVMIYDTPKLYNQDDYNILAALGTSVLNKTYPSRVNTTRAFTTFDELPYPVPTGATSYFMVLLTVIFTWYFTRFLHWLLRDMVTNLDLFPITEKFPNVNIYTLQQSRRESRLNRDSRNTWSWLAMFYLLKPDDNDVNPDEVFEASDWDDFRVPHDVWKIIKAVLRINSNAVTIRGVGGEGSGKANQQPLESASVPVGLANKRSLEIAESKHKPAPEKDGEDARLWKLRNLLQQNEKTGSETSSLESDQSDTENDRKPRLQALHNKHSHLAAASSVFIPPKP